MKGDTILEFIGFTSIITTYLNKEFVTEQMHEGSSLYQFTFCYVVKVESF